MHMMHWSYCHLQVAFLILAPMSCVTLRTVLTCVMYEWSKGGGGKGEALVPDRVKSC